MSYDWQTIITVSAPDDGWVNPNSSSGGRVNRVRDVITLPYGEHKSIAIWVQESAGQVSGTSPNATMHPSLRILAAVIDQTRTTESTLPLTRKVVLGEATSEFSTEIEAATLYGPMQAVSLRDTPGSASFVVSFDWGTQTLAGVPVSSHHQLIYASVTNTTISVLETYEDPDQSTPSFNPSILVNAGVDRAVWFKSKTGGDLHTAKVITSIGGAATLTVGPANDLPTSVMSLVGFLGWQGTTYGFICAAASTTEDVIPYTLPLSSTTVTFGTPKPIIYGLAINFKLLRGQRLRTVDIDTFAGIGILVTTTGGDKDVIESYDAEVPYDNPNFYDAAGDPGQPPPSGAVSSYDAPVVYDSSDEYDAGGVVPPGGKIFSDYPQVYKIAYFGGEFAIANTSPVGQLYRTNAIAGSDITLGTGFTAQSSYQATGRGGVVAVANSAYDAITPTASSRFFGQEVLFDPLSGPVRSIYPNTVVPFATKYTTNQATISVGMALVNSGAFVYYISPSVLLTTLDRPLRVSYFEHQFLTSTTPAFPPEPPPPPDDNDILTVKDLFGATTPGRMVCLDADIDLNGLLLNTIDADGVLWLCTGIEGWWTTPDASSVDLPRGELDGSFVSQGRYNSRIITVNGMFLPPHRSRVLKARNKLINAINLVRVGGFLRTDDDQYRREASIWLSGRPEIDTINQKGRTEFSIGLRAPDPIKYEVVSETPSANYRIAQTTLTGISNGRTYNKTFDFTYNFDGANPSGDIIATNHGNQHVHPIITVVGPLTADAQVRNITTDQSIIINGAVGAQQTIEIDTEMRQVSVNGQPNFRTKIKVASDWIHLNPGPNILRLIGTNSGGLNDAPPRLIVKWRSGWIG